ncbi:MAG: PAS domain S-box protein [Methanoregula sp.]|uniref:PAS domain-containing protein n=1 Tax=Methanoregula sp. TaxID=2052170 RepID=UPI003C501457
MNEKIEPTPFDQRLFLIFIVTFATMTAFEFAGQFFYPHPPDWRSNLITSLFASALAVIIAYFPLNAYYTESARVFSEMERRHRVETDLRESESRLGSIIRVAPIGICAVSDRIIQMVNDQLCTITGYTAEELTGTSTRLLYPAQEDYDSVGREICAQIAQDGSGEIETRWRRKDGAIIDVLLSSTPVDPSDISSGLTFTALDITEQKRAEMVLRESENKFATVFRTSPVALSLVSVTEGTFLDVNDAFVKNTGYSRDEVIGRTAESLGLVADRKDLERMISLLRDHRGVSGMEVRCRIKNGEIRTCLFSSSITLMGGKPYVLSSVADITEGKKAEEALRESEERFRTILNSMQSGIVIIDSHTHRILDVNPKALEMIGEMKESVVGAVCHNFICPAESGKCPVMDLGQAIDSSERILLTSRGQKIPILKSVIKTMLGGREVLVESFFDVTERKKAEEALRESEEKFRTVVENTLDGILIVSMTGEILFGNRALANIFDAEGKSHRSGTTNVMKYIAPESRSQVLSDFSQVAQGIDSYPMTYRAITATGRRIWVECIGKRILFQNLPAILISMKDISSRKHMEEAILRANKKLNLLSGITRHDINNQLQVLNGYIDLLHMTVPDPSFEDHFSHIMEASSRITTMIRFTKEYEEIGVHAALWQDLHALMNSAVKGATLGQVTLKNDLPASTEVFADPLIVKVFFNLIDNALRHGNRTTTIRFSFEAGNGHGIIVCEDDGSGVPEENKEKIFTRGFGKNTGLGLAISREILDITGITIRETGEPGRGARFEIVVPEEAYRFVNPAEE